MQHYRRDINPSTVIIAGTLFIFSTFSLVHSFSNYYHRKGGPSNGGTDWDLIIFTQNWPLSVCTHWMQRAKGNTCQLPLSNSWTIHGLWPTKLGTMGPDFCDPSKPFNPEAIYGIEDKLNKQWTTIEIHKKRTFFWSHEWAKHGTCAQQVPAMSSEFLYFNQGLKWNDQYNMVQILKKAQITPGSSYNVTDVWNGVKNVLKKNPSISCFNSDGGQAFILEIKLCFDKQLRLTNCDGILAGSNTKSSKMQLTNCAINKPVVYPSPDTLTALGLQLNSQLKETPLMTAFKFLQLIQWGTF